MSDRVVMVGAMTLAYGIGWGVLRGAWRLLSSTATPTQGWGWMLVAVPLVACLVAELATGLWEDTPGALGTGGLVVVLPMLVAGLLAAVLQTALTAWAPPPPGPGGARAGGAALTLWLGATLALTAAGLALWRWWPEPRARLF